MQPPYGRYPGTFELTSRRRHHRVTNARKVLNSMQQMHFRTHDFRGNTVDDAT